METIGDRIKQARKARGLSQQELAEACSWEHQSRISGYERMGKKGGREPSSEEIAIIAKALRIRLAWLATKDGSMDGADISASSAQGQQASASLSAGHSENPDTESLESQIHDLAEILTPGEWAYLKEQAQQLISRRLSGALAVSAPIPQAAQFPRIDSTSTGVVKVGETQQRQVLEDNREAHVEGASMTIGEIMGSHGRDRKNKKPGDNDQQKVSQ